MNLKAWALAIAWTAAFAASVHARDVPPVQLATLPHIVIASPQFFWSNTPDEVRMASATCPNGRAIGGGLSVRQGGASLRIQESYPDGASWVVRFAAVRTEGPAPPAQTLRVRGFALCALPVSRDHSVLVSHYPRLLYQSNPISIPGGAVSTSARQACPDNTLVVSGGIGHDMESSALARLRIELNFPDAHGWNVRAANDAAATAPPADMRVHGVCISKNEGVDISKHRTVSFVQADIALKPDGGTLRQSVVCKDAQAHALAGGFRVLRGKSTLELRESFPDTPSSWTIALSSRAAKNAGTAVVRLYAVCLGP